MLKISNASVVSDQHDLLNDVDLEIKENKLHVVIGASGSGKTTLSKLISGSSDIIQSTGTLLFNKKNINRYTPEERAKLGIFVSYQDPPFIDGITNIQFTKIALSNIGDNRSAQEVERDYRVLSLMLGLGSNHGNKILNDHGSLRSETLKNEMLQMLMMNPKLAVLDSIDNDLDSDDLEIMAEIINGFISRNGKMCIVLTNNKSFIKKLNSDEISLLADHTIVTQEDTEDIKRIINNDDSQLL